jgi:hypothetical protein
MKTLFKALVTSTILSLVFAVAVYAATNYTIGSLAITSTYNSTFGTYSYTDANAYATYAVSRISKGSAGYVKYYTTLERSTAGYWQSLGTKTTKLTNANLSARVTWTDINAGSFRYKVVGNTGTTYATMTVGSY